MKHVLTIGRNNSSDFWQVLQNDERFSSVGCVLDNVSAGHVFVVFSVGRSYFLAEAHSGTCTEHGRSSLSMRIGRLDDKKITFLRRRVQVDNDAVSGVDDGLVRTALGLCRDRILGKFNEIVTEMNKGI